MSLAGKRVVVIGGSEGMGYATAQAAPRVGYVNRAELEQEAASLTARIGSRYISEHRIIN